MKSEPKSNTDAGIRRLTEELERLREEAARLTARVEQLTDILDAIRRETRSLDESAREGEE